MADSTLAAPFEGLTLGLPPRTLQLEGGTIIVKLSDRPEDVLVLHEKVLAAASERFAVRFNSTYWAPTREVADDKTGKKLKVYEYYLVCADDTFILTDEVSFHSTLTEMWIC